MDLEDNVRGILADILDLPPDQITSATGKDTTETWDSLAQISIASVLEEEFGITFSVEEIEGMTSYDVVVATLWQKL